MAAHPEQAGYKMPESAGRMAGVTIREYGLVIGVLAGESA